MRKEIITALIAITGLLSCTTSSTPSKEINIIDSLVVENSLGEVIQSTYNGENGNTSYTLTLFYQQYSGDGVFSLIKNGANADTTIYGKRYTLRGDATDNDATVYELRPYDQSQETTYLLYKDSYLQLLDSTLNSTTCKLYFKK